ncbi:hypothetical protein PAECIP111893_02865 [Paenibacillus plantiphilus]|uniref:Multiple sugar transport system substrate-binding protein n=2 Tax=Paenibacillus plantiphilus TaxID=2905650 RepID=A0ABN8GGA7_9BACL|nr:hypothetical protein PAECIP111893_02865 [Paenibacillus plantiphilus]
MRTFYFTMMLTIVICLNAACSPPEVDTVEEVELKVLYASKAAFQSDFHNLIQAKLPNVNIQVIEFQQIFTPGRDRTDSFIAFIKEQRPDLIAIPNDVPGLYSKLVKQDLLEPLDGRIGKDAFDLEALMPGPVEQLRSAGDGSLFALPLTFTGDALFYNKELFDEHGIPYPSDGMTFAEIMQLAQRFAGLKDTFGYSEVYQSKGSLVLQAGHSENLIWLDAAGKKVLFNTDGWRSVLTRIADTLSTGVVFDTAAQLDPSKKQNSLTLDPFLKGKSAMTIANLEYMQNLQKDSFQWGLASEPINPVKPTVSRSLQPSKTIGISRQSAHAETAWQALAFMNSDEAARLRSRVADELPSDLPVRTAFISNERWEPFYRLEADAAKWTSFNSLIEYFTPVLTGIIDNEIARTLSQEQTIDQALHNIEHMAAIKWNEQLQARGDK